MTDKEMFDFNVNQLKTELEYLQRAISNYNNEKITAWQFMSIAKPASRNIEIIYTRLSAIYWTKQKMLKEEKENEL